MTSKSNNLSTQEPTSERSDVIRSRDNVVESIVQLASNDAANVVGDQEHQLRGLIRTLQNRKGRFALIFVVCQDIPLRNELTQRIRDNLSDQSLFELFLEDEEGGLLDKLLKMSGAPDPLFVYGIENLIPPTDKQKLFPSKRNQFRREETIQELQLRREYFRQLNRPLVLWMPEYVYEIIGKQAHDFYSWGAGSTFFFTERQIKKTGLADSVMGIGNSNIIVRGDSNIINQEIGLSDVKYRALHQLPSPPADFTGREYELKKLLDEIKRGATIFGLQGLGGAGKTALALKLSEQIKHLYPDAQFFLDLRGAGGQPITPAQAMSHVIHAYHPMAVLPEREDELQSLYHFVLYNQRAMLLLDNAQDANQVVPLIPPANSLLLVTSRRNFMLPGMKRQLLDALPPDDAVALLHKIVPHIRDWERHDREIAAACGFLPLALRAAGSLLASKSDLNPADYVQLLFDERNRLDVIAANSTDYNVEASLNLSYKHLTPEAARVLRQLTVFAGSFDSMAEEAVCEDTRHKMLSELIQLSFAEYDYVEKRYRLHELVRLFADARLTENERDIAKKRHAEHYLKVLSQANELYLSGGEAVTRAMVLFDKERANIVAGQSWAEAHAATDYRAAELCISYPLAGVWVLLLRQHPREGVRWLESAHAAARKLNHLEAEGYILSNLGTAYLNIGEARKAIEFYERALAINREIGDRRGEGYDLGNLGIAYSDMGEMQKAIEFYERALAINREIGDRRGESAYLGNLGLAYRNLGQAHKAIEYHEQSLIFAREIGDRRGESNALINLGLAYADLGETRTAIEYYEQALLIALELGDRRSESNALSNLGFAYTDLGETRLAIEYFERSLEISHQIGDRRGESINLLGMSLAVDKLGDRERAIALAEESLKIREEIEDPQADKVRKQLGDWQQQ